MIPNATGVTGDLYGDCGKHGNAIMSSIEGINAVGIPRLLIFDQMEEVKKDLMEKESVLIALSGMNGPHYSSPAQHVRTSTSREGGFFSHRFRSSCSCSKSPSSRLVNGPRATTICTASVCDNSDSACDVSENAGGVMGYP